MKSERKCVARAAGALVLWTCSALSLPNTAAGEPGSDGIGTPSLNLVWNDHYGLFNRRTSNWGYEAMKREIDKIFRPIGIDVAVTENAKGRPSEIFVVLIPWDGSRWGLSKNAMGAIPVGNNRTGSVYIFVPVIMKVLGHPPNLMRRPHKPQKTAECARALARVVAHEVVHTLVPHLGHDSKGIMDAEVDRNHLLSPNRGIGKDFADGLRSELAKLTARP